MTRTASNTDFHVDVEGVGRFRFAHRKMGDQLLINREYSLIVNGVTPTEWLDSLASALSTLRVLTVEAPEDFVLDELDPLEDDSYTKIFKVWGALREKETSFRQGKKGAGPVGGAGAGGQP